MELRLFKAAARCVCWVENLAAAGAQDGHVVLLKETRPEEWQVLQQPLGPTS